VDAIEPEVLERPETVDHLARLAREPAVETLAERLPRKGTMSVIGITM